MSVLKGPLRRLTSHWVISPTPSGAGVIISVSCLVDHLFAPFIKTLVLLPLPPEPRAGIEWGLGTPCLLLQRAHPSLSLGIPSTGHKTPTCFTAVLSEVSSGENYLARNFIFYSCN